MLRNKILISLLSVSIWTTAQTQDSLFQVQQSQINELQQKVQSIEQISHAYHSQISDLKLQAKELNLALRQKQAAIDSLAKVEATNSKNIKATADKLGVKIQSTDDAVSQNAEIIKSKTIWGLISVVITLLVSVIVALLLYKKGQKTSDDKIALLKKQANELNEKIVGQFSNEMAELQKIGDVLKNTGANTSAEPDHSLVKTLADRITFMEMTLYRMDSSVKGHKQLSKSIAQMKDNLLANGYEIVDMLGREYDEGMKVTANFIEDENIEAGKQIITSIVKPQINYKGVMIQSAQITVSQN